LEHADAMKAVVRALGLEVRTNGDSPAADAAVKLTIWHAFPGTELALPSGSTARSARSRRRPIRDRPEDARRTWADS